MSTDQSSIESNDPAPIANTIADPNISFSDFQTLRRGGEIKPEIKSAPVLEKEPEQNKPAKSDPAESEEEGDESDVDADDESADPKDLEGKPKKKSGWQRRIDKLNARNSAAQEQADYWKAQALKGAEAPKKEAVVEKVAATNDEPNADDFETHSEYVKAITKWTLKQDHDLRTAESEKSKLEADFNKRMEAHFKRVDAFAEKNKDYAEVMKSLDDITAPAISQLITESENGPELLYALAKNPSEARRIAALSPMAAAREIGKLEVSLAKDSEEPVKETKKLTNAPKPLTPVGGSKGTVAKSIYDPNIAFGDYVRERRESMKRK